MPFGLVETTTFWLSGGDSDDLIFDSLYSASTLRIFPDGESCRDTLATIHGTLSSPIADCRQLRLKREW
ncbi:hypothetical protein F511_16771 [Dorcoceras hygrometricum]|uniref:Uncharacterized protein n=1 Tax=Dorcoceras hygrometricum TaxID=472368 RepID=A0A2Z7BEZ8_9LAMI|nr:hypothetical protein F511_16771 [Dorcoceras hygrometricum]